MTTETAQAVLAIALSPADQMWPLPLVCEYIDGRRWRLRFDYVFNSPWPMVYPSLVIPAGFITDFASIPRFWWRIMPPTDARIGRAAIAHDRFYADPTIKVTQEQADMALRAGMEALGATRFEREACYGLVRTFGRWGFQPRIP